MKNNPKELKNTFVINLLVDNKFRFWRHLFFLVFFFLLLYNVRFWQEFKEGYNYYFLLLVYVFLLIMTYINIYVLVPFFFFKTRYILYFILLAFLVIFGLNLVGYCFNIIFSEHRINKPESISYKRGLFEGAMACIPIILISTTIKLIQKWTRDNIKLTELSNLTLTMELNELRNQINPHFLFNMLNNVKALIRTDPEKATTVIIKLSEFLRYQLYENNEENTLLASEIEFLSNFINLENIRRENFLVEIKSKTDKKTLNSTFVPPNLFTTFVENAIKHSVDITDQESYVRINIEVENRKLYFQCCNSQNTDHPIPESKYSGLGLTNIKRRLELLYQNNFDLKITSTKDEYIINLMIPV